jgi:Bacterial Ig-like domain (group 2)
MSRLLTFIILSQAVASPSFGYVSSNLEAAAATTAPTIVSAYLADLGNAKTIVVGRKQQYTAHVTYSDGSLGQLPDGRGNRVTWWGTSNPAAATISSGGDVTAVGAGMVTIWAKIGKLVVTPRRLTVSNAVVPVVVQQPTINCSANPSMINQGGTTTITAIGRSAQNLPLTYSYSTSTGSINGADTSATLETSGVSAGIITITCTVYQQGGGTASGTTNVLVQSVTGEQAVSNFQFTDSVGVNVHLSVDNTPYVTQFPQILQSMVQLGIKHYRDGLNQYMALYEYENAEMLGKAGIKTDWLMDFNNTASLINSAYALAPDATETFEGPNEEDANVGSPVLAFMQLLNKTVRGNPATATMPIIAPSFVQPSSFATQGSLGSLVNHGNTHDYFGNRNPETVPYGGPFYNCGAYGSMQFNVCLAQMVAANDSVVATETGYQSGQGLSDAIIGRYELRTLFESINLGISRTYLYELIDNSNCYWGLLAANFSPKPAYTAIHNVLSLLQDVNFGRPGKLNYALTGQTQNVDQVLLQKSNGVFYLAIWLGVQSADPDNPSTIYNVAPQRVILNTNTPIGAATTYVLDDGGDVTSTSTGLTNGSLSIWVTDRVTLVALSPGQSH